MGGENYNTTVNGGIHGPVGHKPEVIRKVERWLEEGKKELPIIGAAVYLADTRDPRWNGEETQKCKKCDISQAGYRSKEMCQDCSDQPAH